MIHNSEDLPKGPVTPATPASTVMTPVSSVLSSMMSEAFGVPKQPAQPIPASRATTGFSALDDLMGELRPGDLIVVSGDTSIGKTSFCLNVAFNVAVRQRLPTGIFSLEMTNREITQRLICAEARINSRDLNRGFLQDGDWHRITDAVNTLYQVPLFLHGRDDASAADIAAQAKHLRGLYGRIGLLVVDYLQQLKPEVPVRAAAALKELAIELHCPVLLVAQPTTAPSPQRAFRTQLTDLGKNAEIADVANVVLFVYRPAHYRIQKPDVAEVIVAKHPQDKTGTIHLGFALEHTRFFDLKS